MINILQMLKIIITPVPVKTSDHSCYFPDHREVSESPHMSERQSHQNPFRTTAQEFEEEDEFLCGKEVKTKVRANNVGQ